MVLGLFVDLSVVNDQMHGTGARTSHYKTRATKAGVVPVVIFMDEARIYAFLDLALDLVALVLWGGVWRPSHHRPFKLGFELEVHLD